LKLQKDTSRNSLDAPLVVEQIKQNTKQKAKKQRDTTTHQEMLKMALAYVA